MDEIWQIKAYNDTGEVVVKVGKDEFWFEVASTSDLKFMESIVRLVSKANGAPVQVQKIPA